MTIKLLDRVIEMSSEEGDLIFDPFGGAGTTYVAAELKNRNWEGIELGPLDDIVNRFNTIENDQALIEKYRASYNHLFPPKVKAHRIQLKLWTDDSFTEKVSAPKLD